MKSEEKLFKDIYNVQCYALWNEVHDYSVGALAEDLLRPKTIQITGCERIILKGETYCQKCESEIVTRDESESKLGFQLLFIDKTECSYCEVYKECRFFPNRPTPDIEETIKMWLDQEIEE